MRTSVRHGDWLGAARTDYLVTDRQGRWLVDVRPGERVRPEDRLRFAASAEVALTLGWRYLVVTGWQPNVVAAIDAVSAQRRALDDPFHLRPQLMAALSQGPMRFVDMVATTPLPALARAQALHLIWHHQLAVDLATPLGDDSLVWRTATSGPRDE